MFDPKSAVEKIGLKFGDKLSVTEDGGSIAADRDIIADVARLLREDCGFTMLADITAADYVDYYEIIYHVMDQDANLLSIRVRLDKDDAEAPTLTPVWKAADVQEREIFDLMGIVFTGHGNLKRILCRDDFEGHPLRKDFKLDRAGRFDQDA